MVSTVHVFFHCGDSVTGEEVTIVTSCQLLALSIASAAWHLPSNEVLISEVNRVVIKLTVVNLFETTFLCFTSPQMLH